LARFRLEIGQDSTGHHLQAIEIALLLSGQTRNNRIVCRLRTIVRSVMPAKDGIHDLPLDQQRKSWMPACAGMTGWARIVRCPKRLTRVGP
jgi:hypothetical protein